MKLRTILAVIILSTPLAMCSTGHSSNAETQKVVDTFFQEYKTSSKTAIVNLLAKNKWITNDDASKVASQIDELAVELGAYNGGEKIGESTYGTSMLQYVYVAKYERQPLKFTFRFYRPNNKWELYSFNYEVDFINELDEAGKAYRLQENDNN
jgi:hypothetical protein